MTEEHEARAQEVLSNYIAVTALEDSEQFGILLPRDLGLLQTPAGHPVLSENYKLLLHMVRELEEYPVLSVADGIIMEPRELCSYLLYSTQHDFQRSDGGITVEQVQHALERDPILRPAAGPEWTDQLRSWEPIGDFLKSIGAKLQPRSGYSEEAWKALVGAVTQRWNKLSAVGNSVVINLGTITGGHLVSSIAYASGACTDIEFGHAVLAATPMHHSFASPSDEATPEEQHSTAFRYYRDLARVCGGYMSFFPPEGVALLIAAGESTTVELKSSLRWDLRQNKKNDAITHEALKTIAAFLNTDGGTLVIGVADDGSAVGIEVDGFPNDDKFLLHLYAVIKSRIGTDVTPLVRAEIELYQGKKVCVVRSTKSPRPVYLQSKGRDEEFFIRTGPSSERLGPSALVEYISKRFGRD